MSATRNVALAGLAGAAGAAYPWLRAVQAYGSRQRDVFDLRPDLAFLVWIALGIYCGTVACRWAASGLLARSGTRPADVSAGQDGAAIEALIAARSPSGFRPVGAKATDEDDGDDKSGPGPVVNVCLVAGPIWVLFPFALAVAMPSIGANELPTGMYVPLGFCFAFLFAYVLAGSPDVARLQGELPLIQSWRGRLPRFVGYFFFLDAMGFLAFHGSFVSTAHEERSTPFVSMALAGLVLWLPGFIGLLIVALIHSIAELRLYLFSRRGMLGILAGAGVGSFVPGLALLNGIGPGYPMFNACLVLGAAFGALLLCYFAQAPSSRNATRHGGSSEPTDWSGASSSQFGELSHLGDDRRKETGPDGPGGDSPGGGDSGGGDWGGDWGGGGGGGDGGASSGD